MNSHLRIIFLTSISLLSLFMSGCGGGSVIASKATPTPTPTVETTAITAATANTEVAMTQATSTQCPTGGTLLEVFLDSNSNHALDANETIVSSTPVCNGANGTNGNNGAAGLSTGIMTSNASTGSCPAGGTTLTTFQDLNSNGALDSGEGVTSVTTVCNGIAGINGTNGSNGTNAALSSTAATTAQCANGGVVYKSSTDGASPQINVICNGANGQNGTNGSNGTSAVFAIGAVGPTVKGKAYTACHHDYLYVPDTVRSSRGWLIFRHQFNGSADQGIGTTGFNLWDIDIADFSLVSEDRRVNYCNLHWDPGSKILTYTVVDHTDGMAGATGNISLAH